MLSDSGYDFKVLFENKTVGIIIVNDSGAILEANIYAGVLFGYTPCELRTLSIDDLVPKDIKAKHAHYRHQYHESPRTRVMGAGMNLNGKRKDGSVFPLEISLSPFEKDGKHLVTAFVMDVTIRRQNESMIRLQNEELETVTRQLEKLNSDLEQKVSDRTKILQETLFELEASRNELSDALNKEKELGELKSRFVSMASHEFRTPLSTILSSAGLISRYIDNGQIDKCVKHLYKIKHAVEHLNTVLEDFLSLGKIEEGRIQPVRSEIHIDKELKQLAVDMQEIAKSGQQIIVQTNENIIVKTDKGILRNALINLLSNAIKFSDENQFIYLKTEEKDGLVLIHVQDAGIGIPEEDQKHLFDRFFRASNASNIQGTGLGLYIVKRYAEMLKGQLTFVSEKGKGTTFTIQLPI